MMALTRVPDLDGLQLLLRVDELGSLGRAGQAHGISQPAVSARIRGLERLVGLPLVERSARGSRLTPDGALLAGWARDVLAAAEVLAIGIDSLRSDHDSQLRVAASMTVAEHLLPAWLVRLAAARPETTVSLRAANSHQVEEAVRDGSADLGFVEGPRVAADLDSRVVAEDRLVVVAPPDHPWSRVREAVSAREVATTRLVHREAESGTRSATETALARFAPLPAPLLELSTSAAVVAAVAAGAGPAVLSELAVRDDVAAHRVVEVPVTGAVLGRRLRAVWPRGQRPGAPARDLLAIAGPPPVRRSSGTGRTR